jgi:hypothetical protein
MCLRTHKITFGSGNFLFLNLKTHPTMYSLIFCIFQFRRTTMKREHTDMEIHIIISNGCQRKLKTEIRIHTLSIYYKVVKWV